jgi:predicted esterase
MRFKCTTRKIGFVVVALCLVIGLAQVQLALAQQTPTQTAPPADGQRGGRGQQPSDPRVQNRIYFFEETKEYIPFAVFRSSKVRQDKKNPLIIALHGLGGSPLSLLRGNALDLAEESGYILVGPMGYNPRGWYGVPAGGGRGGGRGAAPNPANPANPPAGAPQRGAQAPRGANPGLAAAANDPPNLRELSEKDVMHVLDMIRKEFNVDERRTYLMGHSMGGAGTFHLGVKYPSNWAAIAAIAPAAFGLQPDMLASVKGMPVIIVQGDADTAVPVTNTRRWAEKLKELNMTHEYHEIPKGDHGNVISIGMPDIYKFFSRYSK